MSDDAAFLTFVRKAIDVGGASLKDLIAMGVRSAAAGGGVKTGDRVPSTRALAAALAVSPVTVSAAYRQLLAEGLLRSHVGRGTFVEAVTEVAPSAGVERDTVPILLAENPGARVRLVSRWLAAVDRKTGINLLGGYSDTALPPAQGYLKHLTGQLRRHPEVALEFARGLGDGTAREAVSLFAARHLGVDVRPEHIFVGTSAHQFLDAITRTFLEPGDVVICEAPTFYSALDLFAIAGLKVVPIPSDEDGINPAALERALLAHRSKLIYLTGSPSNPRGKCPPLARQQQILDLAHRHQALVIEDSSLFPYWFERRPVQLKSLDRAGQVILLCSFSKLLFSGLRLAAAVASPLVARRLGDALQSYWRIGAVLPQRALASYIQSERMATDLNSARLTYLQRRNVLVEALGKCMDAPVQAIPDGGLTLWLDLPPGVSGESVCERLVAEGIHALPAEIFLPAQGGTDGLRLSYAQASEADLRRAAPVIARTIRALAAEAGQGR